MIYALIKMVQPQVIRKVLLLESKAANSQTPQSTRTVNRVKLFALCIDHDGFILSDGLFASHFCVLFSFKYWLFGALQSFTDHIISRCQAIRVSSPSVQNRRAGNNGCSRNHGPIEGNVSRREWFIRYYAAMDQDEKLSLSIPRQFYIQTIAKYNE